MDSENKRTGSKKTETGKAGLFCATLAFLLIAGVNSASGFYVSLDASAGYNDNASSAYEADGTGFAYFGLQTGEGFEVAPMLNLDIYLTGSHNQRFRLEDSFNAGIGGELSLAMSEGRVLAALFGSGSVYRDDLNTDDEGDDFKIGARIDWAASGRLTLGIEQMFNWFDYRNRIEILDPPPPIQANGNGQPPPPTPTVRYLSRRDRHSYSVLRGTVYLSPDVQADLAVEYDDCSSSADEESYGAIGFMGGLLWTPHELWQIYGLCSWKRTDYDLNQPGDNRKDTITGASVTVSRFFENAEFYVKGAWTEDDAWQEFDSYTQRVGQCGIRYTF